jgi:hypothetical protein
MCIKRMLLLALLITSAGASVAPAQILDKVRQQVKQKISGAKMRLEDSVATHATQPLDSVLTRAVRPVDSTTARAGGDASSIVTKAIRRKESTAQERRIRDGLASGRLELASVTFDAEIPSASSRSELDVLAGVLASLPNMFLIQIRPEVAGAPGAPAKTIADQRAAALKAWLVSRGVPAARVFATSDGEPAASGALVTVIRLQ